jgi:hypothetical protein
MTNTEKLIKAINFINNSSFAVEKFFVIEDGMAYSIISYFYDYHKGDFSVTDKRLITEEEAIVHLNTPLINNALNDILEAQEIKAAKQLRIANFYASK